MLTATKEKLANEETRNPRGAARMVKGKTEARLAAGRNEFAERAGTMSGSYERNGWRFWHGINYKKKKNWRRGLYGAGRGATAREMSRERKKGGGKS